MCWSAHWIMVGPLATDRLPLGPPPPDRLLQTVRDHSRRAVMRSLGIILPIGAVSVYASGRGPVVGPCATRRPHRHLLPASLTRSRSLAACGHAGARQDPAHRTRCSDGIRHTHSEHLPFPPSVRQHWDLVDLCPFTPLPRPPITAHASQLHSAQRHVPASGRVV